MTFPYSKPLVYTVPPSYYPYGYYNYYQWLYGTKSDKPCKYVPPKQNFEEEKTAEEGEEEAQKKKEEEEEVKADEEEIKEVPPEILKEAKRRRRRKILKILKWIFCCPFKCTLFCIKFAIRRFWLWCCTCLLMTLLLIVGIMYLLTKVFDPNKMFQGFLDWLQPQLPKEGFTLPEWTWPKWNIPTLPQFTIPTLPSFTLPKLTIPPIPIPTLPIPKVTIPELPIPPAITLPKLPFEGP